MGGRFRTCICSRNKTVTTNHVIARYCHIVNLPSIIIFSSNMPSSKRPSVLVVRLGTTNANVRLFPFRSSPTDPTTTTVLPKLVPPLLLSQKLSRNHPMLTGKRFYRLFLTLRQQESTKIVTRLLNWRRLFRTKTAFKWKMQVLFNLSSQQIPFHPLPLYLLPSPTMMYAMLKVLLRSVVLSYNLCNNTPTITMVVLLTILYLLDVTERCLTFRFLCSSFVSIKLMECFLVTRGLGLVWTPCKLQESP